MKNIYNEPGNSIHTGEIAYLVLWLTEDCNLRCRYCYADSGINKRYMGFSTAQKAIELLKEEGILQLAGGEPLLNFPLVQEISSFLSYSHSKVRLRLQTNACMVDSYISSELKRMGIAVGVSFDGSADINEALRGGTAAAIQGIKVLGQEGLKINLNCVLSEENVDRLHELADMAFYMGNVKGIGIDLLRNAGRARDQSIKKASAEAISRNYRLFYERTKEIYLLSGRKIVLREVEEARQRLLKGSACSAYCYAAAGSAMTVLPGGDMYPCGSLIGQNAYWMGNIHEPPSYRRINLYGIKSAKCNGCKYCQICPGACPSRSLLNEGTFGYTEEDCALRKTAFLIVDEENNLRGG